MDTLSFWPVSSIPYDQEQQHPHQQQQHHHHQQQQQQQQHHPHSALRPQAVGETMISSATSSEPSPPIPQTPYSADHGYLKREWEEDQPEEKVPEASSENQMQDELLDGELGEADERPLRRKRRVKGQRICGVCGDLAQSHNFGALTCETCKAFFRRNAFKQKELQNCVFNSSCTITKSTRRFCAPCRLKKCFAIGMDPDLILDDEEKKARQSKKERDLAYGVGGEGTAGRKDRRTSSCTDMQQPQVSTSSIYGRSASSSLSPGSTWTVSPGSSSSQPEASSESGKAPTTVGGGGGPDSKEAAGGPQVNDFPGKGKWIRPTNALGVQFKHVSREQLPWDMQLYWPLTLGERELLTQLTGTYQTVTSSTSQEDIERMKQFSSFCIEKAIFSLEHSLRQYVRFARVVPEFRQLKQNDQITTLKSSAIAWYHIRMAAEYVLERSAWINAFGVTSTEELVCSFGDQHAMNQYSSFCENFKFLVKNDMTLYALMHTLMLFDPSDINIEDRLQINRIKDSYTLLLKHYVESQFSFLHSDRYLAEIIAQLVDLRQLSQSSTDFYKHFSSHFKPLLAEVLSS